MAHKKAAGSAKNLRDSNPKYRGVKIFWWQPVVAWNIIIRQKWNKYEAGENTYLAKDFSIHANIDGIVTFTKKNKLRFDGRRYLKTVVHVVSAQEVKTEIKKAPEKKVEAKKTVAKKTPAKKPVVKKPAAKKTVAKKAPAKKVAAKKPAAKKTVAKKTTK